LGEPRQEIELAAKVEMLPMGKGRGGGEQKVVEGIEAVELSA
jgi:hypothetical protein